MEVRAFDISYLIEDEDVEANVDGVIDIDDLDFANEDLSLIAISKQILDSLDDTAYIIITSIPDECIGVYSVRDLGDVYECTLKDTITYDDYIDELIKSLPEELDIHIDDDEFVEGDDEEPSNLELPMLIADKISNKTGFLVDDFKFYSK